MSPTGTVQGPASLTGATAGYRGRLAPSPTGFLHLGHARTFWVAQSRARDRKGVLVLRNEDLDAARCRPAYVDAMFEDLRWFGFDWQEGPGVGGEFGPYSQSQRQELYRATFERLERDGRVYPCACSRQDVLRALRAPHANDEEPVYPGTCRPTGSASKTWPDRPGLGGSSVAAEVARQPRTSWRFRVPDGEAVCFEDGFFGSQRFIAGVDFGDFVVWRHDRVPSYQLAVVVDDAAMRITEVVRGADLLVSTARQLLIYRALGWTEPQFFHCPLVTDIRGIRLAKRDGTGSLRALRASGQSPENLRASWALVTSGVNRS